MTISATIQTQPVSATVNAGGTVQASVSSQTATATLTGGIGPQGPVGPQGIPGDALAAASDVVLSGVADGDVIRYSAGKFRNFKEIDLTIDGGNF